MPSEKPAKPSLLKEARARLEALLQKLPRLNISKQKAMDTGCAVLALCSLLFVCSRLPELHNIFLRAKVGSRVYKIQAQLNGGGGTGFQIKAPSGQNYIMTNSHVCEHVGAKADGDNKGTALVVSDDGSYVRRRIVAVSDESDLCLIEGMPGVDGLSVGSEPGAGPTYTVVGHPHLRPITLSSGEIIGSEDVQILDHIISVEGNPFVAMMLPPVDPNAKCDKPKNEIKSLQLPPEIGGGTVNICFVNTEAAYMTSIVIYPGNSGSPMVDYYGRVVGVAFAANDSDNYGEVVSLHDIQHFLAKY